MYASTQQSIAASAKCSDGRRASPDGDDGNNPDLDDQLSGAGSPSTVRGDPNSQAGERGFMEH